MNKRIQELWDKASVGTFPSGNNSWESQVNFIENFVESIKQAIYDDVKEELIDDSLINAESDSLSREYLRGCNGGIVDALFQIKHFGKDDE